MINYGNCHHQADVNALTCCHINIHFVIFHIQTILTKSKTNILLLVVFNQGCHLILEDKVTYVSLYLVCNSFTSGVFLRSTIFLTAIL